MENVIEMEAKRLAADANIADVGRVISVLRKTAVTPDGSRFLPNKRDIDVPESGLVFFPSLKEALWYLPPDEAMSLFESSDLDQLAFKSQTVEYWKRGSTPFYLRQELVEMIEGFIRNLYRDKLSLLSIGYPSRDFRPSYWLVALLSRLYPIKVPYSAGYIDSDEEGNPLFHYRWVKAKNHLSVDLDSEPYCPYEEAPVIGNLTKKDVERIKELRLKLFGLKVTVLDCASKHLASDGGYESFWGECRDAITEFLTMQDFGALSEIERKHRDFFSLPEHKHSRGFDCGSGLFYVPSDTEAGGITNLFEFMTFVAEELRIGKMHHTKAKLLSLNDNKMPVSYYRVVDSPNISEIDKAILDSVSYLKEEANLNKELRERTINEIFNKLKVPLFVPFDQYRLLKPFAELLREGRMFGLDIVGRVAPVSAKENQITPMELPPGTKWEDINIKFLDGHNVKISVGDLNLKTDYKEMGFEDKRRQLPNNQWKFLEVLATSRCQVAWGESAASWSLKKSKQLLSKTLKEYFQIQEDPFHPYKQEKAYKIRIRLIPESSAAFSVNSPSIHTKKLR
ncbi:MAG: hypothetical protein WBF13_02225 [Candidatus Zixiibacteriota bacterium]